MKKNIIKSLIMVVFSFIVFMTVVYGWFYVNTSQGVNSFTLSLGTLKADSILYYSNNNLSGENYRTGTYDKNEFTAVRNSEELARNFDKFVPGEILVFQIEVENTSSLDSLIKCEFSQLKNYFIDEELNETLVTSDSEEYGFMSDCLRIGYLETDFDSSTLTLPLVTSENINEEGTILTTTRNIINNDILLSHETKSIYFAIYYDGDIHSETSKTVSNKIVIESIYVYLSEVEDA